MLKHFCDICGQELYDYQPKDGMYIDSTCDTKIVSIQNPNEKSSFINDNDTLLERMEVCSDCEKKILNYINNTRISHNNSYKKSKREIGDKVRCLITNARIGLYSGHIYTVCDIPKDYDDAVYVDVGKGWQSLLKFGQYSYCLE